MSSTAVGRRSGTCVCLHIHMIKVYSKKGLYRPCHHRHYHSYRSQKSSKELANISDITWQSGRSRHSRDNNHTAQHKAKFKPPLGPLHGNSYRVYIDSRCHDRKLPNVVPTDSEIYMAFQEMSRVQQTARFNPWSLLLELLDDPRLLFNEKRRNRLLSAISQLGWINTQNVLAQRPLFAYHLLKNRCFTLAPKYSSMQTNPETEVDTENERSQIAQLSPAQSITLHQIQWPHYIANKYEALASLSASKNQRDSAEWDRIWLCTNTCMEELRTAYIKNRVAFNLRMSVEEQLQRLIRGSFDHAPGLVLNAIMSWNDDQYAILNPYVKQRLLSIYFANRETTKQTVVQAWQMYDWLIYSNSKFVMPAACMDYKGKLDSRSLTRSLLYRSLNSFDNWDEATHSLERLSCRWGSNSEQHPEIQQTASDRKLVDKYFNMRMQLPMTRLIK